MSTITSCQVNFFITPREREVVILLSEGLTCKEIGYRLFISTHTVESHKRNLIEKVNAKNTVEMVCKVLKKDLLSI